VTGLRFIQVMAKCPGLYNTEMKRHFIIGKKSRVKI
jgi:hypothetical protein